MKFKRKGELRETTESLVISLNVEIEQEESYLCSLKTERSFLKKKLEQED